MWFCCDIVKFSLFEGSSLQNTGLNSLLFPISQGTYCGRTVRKRQISWHSGQPSGHHDFSHLFYLVMHFYSYNLVVSLLSISFMFNTFLTTCSYKQSIGDVKTLNRLYARFELILKYFCCAIFTAFGTILKIFCH
jgi:hypothetical protein